MEVFIIKGGKFLNRETGEEKNEISGKLTSVACETNEETGNKTLVLTFDTGEGQATVRVMYVGDASLKILRCLANVADELRSGNIGISFEEREGKKSRIVVTMNGVEVPPAGMIEQYASEKKALTDSLTSRLKRATSREPINVLVYADNSGADLSTLDAVLSNIRTLRNAGRGQEITCKHHGFTDPVKAAGYIEALADINPDGSKFKVFRDAESILAIQGAMNEPLEHEAVADVEEEQ